MNKMRIKGFIAFTYWVSQKDLIFPDAMDWFLEMRNKPPPQINKTLEIKYNSIKKGQN